MPNRIVTFFETLAKNRVRLAWVLTGVFVFGFGITYLVFTLVNSPTRQRLPSDNGFAKATPAPVNEVVPEKGVYNILLLGHGGPGHEGSLLTDTIIIAHLDTNAKKVTLITIPRDLWVPEDHKINSAGVATGFQNIGTELTNVTGLPINYYVAVDFGSFAKLIDSLSGITVDVPVTFSDSFYPILGEENNTCGKTEEEIFTLKNKFSGFDLEKQFTCRYETISFDKGKAELDGKTALKFVRSRHGDSDFGRSLRQIAVLKGILNKLITFQAAGNINNIIGELNKLVRTDLNAGVIKTLIEIIGDPKAYQVNYIQLTTENVLREGKSSDGQYIIVPKAGNFNFSDVKSFIASEVK